MKKRFWQRLRRCHLFLTIISLSFTLPALAGKPSGGGTISFGITAGKAKMADATTSYGGATYGPGYHNMVIVGNVVYAAYTNTSEANGGEREVRVVTSNDGFGVAGKKQLEDMAGASGIQVVSALLRNGPGYLATVLAELRRWFEEHEYTSMRQAVGSMSLARCPDPSAYERGNSVQILQSWHG